MLAVTYLIEEDLSLSENMLKLGQLQEIAFERLSVQIYFPQLVFQFLEGGLQIDHLPGLRSLRILAGIQHRYTVLLDFLLQVAQLALHLVAPAYLVDEFSLKGIDVGIQL